MWGLSAENFVAKGIVMFVFALALSAAVNLMLRRQTPVWALAALLILPFAALFSLPVWRMFSWHGWLPFSIVHDIFERGVVIPLAPSWFIAALSLACLLGTIVTLDRLASTRPIRTRGTNRLLALFHQNQPRHNGMIQIWWGLR